MNYRQEYQRIVNELSKLDTIIDDLKVETRTKLQQAKTEQERSAIMTKFRFELDKVHKDPELRERYRKLLARKNELHSKINEKPLSIREMLSKYQTLVNNTPIPHRIVMNSSEQKTETTKTTSPIDALYRHLKF